jgi:arsenate reductase
MEKVVNKSKVAFICVHNSCRSQMAQAIGTLLASAVFESFSAGTHPVDCINPDAVRLIKQKYGIDMEKTQYPKLLNDIPPVDVVVTMGCNVDCPFLPCKRRLEWSLEDPSGKGDAAFLAVMDHIEQNILNLKDSLSADPIL